MRKKHCKLILSEAQKWQADGVISPAILQQLEKRYASVIQGKEASLRTIIFLSLGALLISLGVISLLAANWDDLSRPLRSVIAFTPLILSVTAWYIGQYKSLIKRSFLEPLAIFWTLSLGAGIAIISQTYQISGSADNFVLTWALLTLPVLYATLALLPAVGYFVLLFVWVCINAEQGTGSQLYWVLILPALPALRTIKLQAPSGPRFALTIEPCALISVAALGFTLEKTMPGLWSVIYSGLFATLYLCGLLFENHEDSEWHTPMHTIGLCGQVILLYLLTFKWPWEEIGWNHWHYSGSVKLVEMLFDFVLAFGLPLATILLGIKFWRKVQACPEENNSNTVIKYSNLVLSSAPLVVAVSYCLASYQHTMWFTTLVTTGFLVVIGLLTLARGLIQQQLRWLNGGVLILLAIILGKFFTSDYSFTIRGLIFLLCGLLFFAANWIASHRFGRDS